MLQTVAWTTMIVSNVQKSEISAAIRDTFSGEKPCRLCHLVQDGREQEQQLPATVTSDKKVEKFLKLAISPLRPPPVADFSYPPVTDSEALSRPLDPPLHVPIAA